MYTYCMVDELATPRRASGPYRNIIGRRGARMGRMSGKAAAPARRRLAPIADLAQQQRQELAAIRERAMRLLARLDRIAEGDGKPDETDAGLLGKGGVIDGLNTVSLILTRVIDRERKSFGGDQPSTTDPIADEQEIERRILAELDRIAARQRPPGGDPPGGA
jgi:hypothetical protein